MNKNETTGGFTNEDAHLDYKSLYKKYYSRLCSHAESITHDEAESRMIANDAIDDYWIARPTLEADVNISAYLYVSARNKSFKYLKNRKNDEQKRQEYAHHLSQLSASTSNPELGMVHTEIKRMVWEEVNRLPEKCRKVMTLHLKEFSHDEIMDQLGMSYDAVKANISLAKKKLKAILPSKYYLFFLLFMLNRFSDN